MAKDRPLRVLLVDDDADDHVLTRDLLKAIPEGRYSLDWMSDYEGGLTAICSGSYDVVLLDYRLGEKTGLDLLTEIRCRVCDVPVIVLTGMSDPEIDLVAMQSGATDYIEKARLDPILLDRAIRYAIQQRQHELDLERRVKQRTEELNLANETLREMDRRKDEFLATLAHELRNPLAPVRNALEVMRLSEGDLATMTSARGIINRQISHLIRLIDDLLDVSRISRGKFRVVLEPMTIGDAIESAVEQSKPVLDKAKQTLAVDVPQEPIRLTGDRVRISQVFTNLLNNAAKYSEPNGQVFITAARQGENVIVTVRDSGLGISADLLPHIFEPFTQIYRTLDRAQGGLGIGLSLVKSIVTMHGGTITASSAGPNRGAEFVVTLPCVQPPTD